MPRLRVVGLEGDRVGGPGRDSPAAVRCRRAAGRRCRCECLAARRPESGGGAGGPGGGALGGGGGAPPGAAAVRPPGLRREAPPAPPGGPEEGGGRAWARPAAGCWRRSAARLRSGAVGDGLGARLRGGGLGRGRRLRRGRRGGCLVRRLVLREVRNLTRRRDLEVVEVRQRGAHARGLDLRLGASTRTSKTVVPILSLSPCDERLRRRQRRRSRTCRWWSRGPRPSGRRPRA